MDSNTLPPSHAAKLREHLGPTLGYLTRLRDRMDKRGFLPSDPLYQKVDKALDAMHTLCVDLHYRSCGGGVG